MQRSTRRDFLRHTGALGASLPMLGSLGLGLGAMTRASAAGATGYKALVCIYLYGGNDAYNTVLATDGPSWHAYQEARKRNSNSLALSSPGTPAASGSSDFNEKLGGALAITPLRNQGRSFALHPVLDSVRNLFEAGRLGIVANVGPLAKPTTKSVYNAGAASLPPKLFSHNDQQAVWQTMAVEGRGLGWGGRMADLLSSTNGQERFTSLSLDGRVAWSAGRDTRPYQLAPAGAIHIGGADKLFGSAVVQQKLVALMKTANRGHVLERDLGAVVSRSVEAEGILSSTLPAVGAGPWGTPGVAANGDDPLLRYRDPLTGSMMPNKLSRQLQAVARMIAARDTLGMKRQVFFVALDGFDTHDNHAVSHADGLAKLAQALTYFDSVLRDMGVDDNVTTFTASDFGRSFAGNGDGTDHGWGGHHFVMGGAVRGGDIYGRFPAYGLSDNRDFTSNDQIHHNGILLPAQSVEQYAATLGGWLGLSDAQLLSILPALSQWSSGARDLGFMG